jgi:hypothetical protein
MECWSLQDLIKKLDQNFIQTQMLHADNDSLNENRLLHICRQTSELAAELHDLAYQCNSLVVSKQTDLQTPVYEFDDDGNDQSCKFTTLVERKNKERKDDSDYLVILHRYMWGADWSYDWPEPLQANSEKYYQLVSRIKHLLSEVVETRNRTPDSCILLEVIVCIQDQAHNLYQYVLSCQKYCFSYQRETPRNSSDREEPITQISMDSDESDWLVPNQNEYFQSYRYATK